MRPAELTLAACNPARVRRIATRGAIGALVLGAWLPTLATSSGAGADTVSTLQAKAAALGGKVDALNTKLSILGEEYDQAAARASTLKQEIGQERTALGAARSTVSRDAANLNRQAVDAYVNAGSTTGLSVALSANSNVLPVQQTYLSIASGSLSGAMTSLENSEHQLSVRSVTLSEEEQAAQQAAQTLAASRASAENLESELSTTLAGVKGNLATAVAQQEAVQRAAAARSAAAAAAAAAAASPTLSSTSSAAAVVTPSAPAVGSGAGEQAVRAAETQLGVPYVWAGSTPGAGFDCSGLTMWAWGKAGVSLPHSAEAQYDSIEHVPLDQLEPGDLVFYASGGYIYHVVMYIGNGQVIQAEDTGTVISITPLWPYAYGAGRP